MGAVAYDGDLAAYADEVPERSAGDVGERRCAHRRSMPRRSVSCPVRWSSISPTIDALCHAWDLSASLGRPLEFPRDSMPAVTAIVDATCTDDVRALGLIKAVQQTAPDASDTDRLMAKAGRSRYQM